MRAKAGPAAIAAIGVAIVAATQVGLIGDYGASLLVYIGLAGIVAIGLTLLTGVGGMTSFGQAAFVGVGAYASAILNLRFGLSSWESLPVALLVTGLSATVIGAITVRLAGHYLPLGTIAWGLAIYFTFGNSEWLGGHDGLRGIEPVFVGQTALIQSKNFLVLVAVCVAAAIVLTDNILDSRIGRALRSLREDSLVGDAFGVDAGRLKLAAFVYAALLAGLSGWLYAHFQRSVAPGSFGIVAGMEYLLMVVIGGPGHILGALLGSAVVTLLRDQLQNVLPSLLGPIGNYETVVFGCLIIAVLQGSRAGLGPLVFPDFRNAFKSRSAVAPLLRRALKNGNDDILTVQALYKRFGGLIAVNNISFSVPRASLVGLIGPNGAGKSTTFNVIAGSLSADSGTVVLDRQPIQSLPPHRIAALGIARTFQHSHVVPDMTVIENVMLGAHLRGKAGFLRAMFRINRAEEQQLQNAARDQIERVGLEEAAFARAGSLSLGQLRLLEIARALCLDPSLLMLDEPAAGLRVGEKRVLAALLRELRVQGLSILLVEHDMAFVMSLADKVVVLDFGTLIADGQPATVQDDAAVRAAYLGTAA